MLTSHVFALAECIANSTKEARANKARCENLAKQIAVVTDKLRQAQKNNAQDFEEKMMSGVLGLYETFRGALALVRECAFADSALIKFFKSDSYEDRFNAVERRLSLNEQDLFFEKPTDHHGFQHAFQHQQGSSSPSRSNLFFPP